MDVNLTSEAKVDLKIGAKVKFTYEVNWKPSSTMFENRFNKYLDPNFFQHRVSGIVYELVKRLHLFKSFHIFTNELLFSSDSLVQHLQLVYDGDLPRRSRLYDSHAYSKEGLCSLLQR